MTTENRGAAAASDLTTKCHVNEAESSDELKTVELQDLQGSLLKASYDP
jgi:hypothetical protein